MQSVVSLQSDERGIPSVVIDKMMGFKEFHYLDVELFLHISSR